MDRKNIISNGYKMVNVEGCISIEKFFDRHNNPFIQVKYLGRGESEIHKEFLDFETKDDMDKEYKKISNGEEFSRIVDGECMMCGDKADTKDGWICSDCRYL